MKKFKFLIFNNINKVCLLLSLLMVLVYCLCNGEFSRRYTINYTITTETNGPTELKFYYTYVSDNHFSESKSQSHIIKNTAKTEYDGSYDLYIPISEKILSWRIDLGDKPNSIKLKNFYVDGLKIDNNSIDFNQLIFSSDLKMTEHKDGEFSFVSSGNDPYFIIDQKIPCKPHVSIRNLDIVVILFFLSFFVLRDMLMQYKKFRMPEISEESNESKISNNSEEKLRHPKFLVLRKIFCKLTFMKVHVSKKYFYILSILFCAISSIYIFTGKNFCHEIRVDLTCESQVKCNNTDLQLFYVLKGKNNAFAEDYSISKNIDTYQNVTTSSDFSIAHLRRKNKLTSIRLDLGNAADIQYAIDSFSVNGEEIISNDVHLHDAKLVSINNNKLVLATTGTDPFIYADVSVAPKIDYLCLLNLLQILILFGFVICVIKFRLWRILKNKYVYIFAPLVFFITLFVITNNYNYIVPSVLEWIFAVILLDMFVQYKTFRKLLSLTILIVFGIQAASIANTGEFLVVLTLENLGEYQSVGANVVRLSFFILSAFILIGLFIPHTELITSSAIKRIFFLILSLIIIPVANANGYKSPVVSFAQVLSDYVKLRTISTDNVLKDEQKFIYGKDNIVFDNASVDSDISLKNKNIIVLFSEGFSAKMLGINNGRTDLTPNLDKLVAKSLYLDNYFNHTAATFRGLRGQLSSSYQLVGGYYNDNSGIGQLSEQELQDRYSDTVVGIPQILKANGYHAYFVVPHSKNHNLAMMLKTLFFDHVFGAEDYLKEGQQRELTDQELFSFINQLIDSKRLIEPYFIGIYNVDTHLGKDSSDLKYHDGSNIILNTVVNYDDAASKLINRFNDESFAKANALIVTADHATFPSPLYKETIDSDAKYFVGKIPFIVYTHGIKHQVIDVNGMNSLSFAPTVLHMMDITEGKNYFLGCSVFDQKCRSDFKYVTNIGSETFETKDSVITVSKDKILEKKILNFYNLSN